MQRLQIPIVVLAFITTACGGGSPVSPDEPADFQGQWQGTWIRTGCAEGAGAAGVCSTLPTSGALSVSLTQTDNAAQGTVSLSPFLVPVSGLIAGDVLSLSGQTYVSVAEGGGATVKVMNWSTTRAGNAMSGAFTLLLEPNDPRIGTITLQVSLQNVVLT